MKTGTSAPEITAAVLVIGDEILSGRTQDTNSGAIARFLGLLGIDLCEIRVVRDMATEIVEALNLLRRRYRYVFTTGGIGPTHDDITADAVAQAFGVELIFHPEALAILEARYRPGEFNEMRRRMARVPQGADLVANPISAAPGFRMDNVYTLAGVPMIMRAMLDQIEPELERGALIQSITLAAPLGEGLIAAALARIQKDYPQVLIGSYPFFREDGFGVQLVSRSRDFSALNRAVAELEAMLRSYDVVPERIGN